MSEQSGALRQRMCRLHAAKWAGALVVAFGVAGVACAAAKPSPPASAPAAAASVPAKVRNTLERLTGGHVQLLRAFQAPAGLLGLVVSAGPGRNAILYATPDGAYLFQGMITAADGRNLTQQQAQQYFPKPPGATENFAALGSTHTFLWGTQTAKKAIWMVADPDCIFCHKMFMAFKPDVEAGVLKVHVIQVGFLKPDSLGKAAAILAASQPQQALIVDEMAFNAGTEEGGVTPDLTNQAAVTKVRENNAWMRARGITGTPYLLYRDKQGKPADVRGYTADVKSLLEQIGEE